MKNLHQLLKTEAGVIEWTTGCFMLIMLGFVCATLIKVYEFAAVGNAMEDACAASGLAAALIDLEEYGTTHNVVINDVENAYSIYREAVKDNLQLDDSMTGDGGIIDGPVEIEYFTVINVDDEGSTAFTRDRAGHITAESFGPGEEITVNGEKVTHTGIYAGVSFPYRVFGDIFITARKQKLVDVVADL